MKLQIPSKKLGLILLLAGLCAGPLHAGDDSFGKEQEQDDSAYQEQITYQGRGVSCLQIAYEFLRQELGISDQGKLEEGKFDQGKLDQESYSASSMNFKKLKLKIERGDKIKCKVK